MISINIFKQPIIDNLIDYHNDKCDIEYYNYINNDKFFESINMIDKFVIPLKLSINNYKKLLSYLKNQTLNEKYNFAIGELIENRYFRMYFDIENIPYSKSNLIYEIIDKLIHYYNLPHNYTLTFNDKSEKHKLSYHLFFPIQISRIDIYKLIFDFHYQTQNKFINFIDLSVYSVNQIFRTCYSIKFLIKDNILSFSYDYHKIINGSINDTIIQDYLNLPKFQFNFIFDDMAYVNIIKKFNNNNNFLSIQMKDSPYFYNITNEYLEHHVINKSKSFNLHFINEEHKFIESSYNNVTNINPKPYELKFFNHNLNEFIKKHNINDDKLINSQLIIDKYNYLNNNNITYDDVYNNNINKETIIKHINMFYSLKNTLKQLYDEIDDKIKNFDMSFTKKFNNNSSIEINASLLENTTTLLKYITTITETSNNQTHSKIYTNDLKFEYKYYVDEFNIFKKKTKFLLRFYNQIKHNYFINIIQIDINLNYLYYLYLVSNSLTNILNIVKENSIDDEIINDNHIIQKYNINRRKIHNSPELNFIRKNKKEYIGKINEKYKKEYNYLYDLTVNPILK